MHAPNPRDVLILTRLPADRRLEVYRALSPLICGEARRMLEAARAADECQVERLLAYHSTRTVPEVLPESGAPCGLVGLLRRLLVVYSDVHEGTDVGATAAILADSLASIASEPASTAAEGSGAGREPYVHALLSGPTLSTATTRVRHLMEDLGEAFRGPPGSDQLPVIRAGEAAGQDRLALVVMATYVQLEAQPDRLDAAWAAVEQVQRAHWMEVGNPPVFGD